LTVLTIDQALTKAESHKSRGELEDAKRLLEAVLQAFPKHVQARKDLASLKVLSEQGDPPKHVTDRLLNVYKAGQLSSAVEEAQALVKDYPEAFLIWNILGAAAAQLGMLEQARSAFQKVISLEPDYADAYNNLGNVLNELGEQEQAILSYERAIDIKPDYAEAHFNMGIVLKDQERIDEGIVALSKVLQFNPEHAGAYYHIGELNRHQGKSDEAIGAYKRATEINPDYSQAYNHMGNAFKALGKFDEAIIAYNKALKIDPDYVECHRNISQIKKYTKKDEQILAVHTLYNNREISSDRKCILSFTLAKMHEDLSQIDLAFHYLNEGNRIRKRLLGYKFERDLEFFSSLKNAQPHLKKLSITSVSELNSITPIFIVGMPRSGTSLVEQIISSHSLVHGAGELKYIPKFGKKIAIGSTLHEHNVIETFRSEYMKKLNACSNGNTFVTDKLPHNFLYVPLICAAFPEAKIIHVKRDPAATCWSNYKHYFSVTGLGYAYDLEDCVSYYKLYEDLLKTWQSYYPSRIYNLNYENLTTNPKAETRQLIKNLGINWEDACLYPHQNPRSVRTASSYQIRKKIYKNSSRSWRVYKPYLNSLFECFDT